MAIALAFLALAAATVIVAARMPGDASWDLRNYHLYNAWALFHSESAGDIMPAQAQTLHSPLLDIPYYLLVQRIAAVSLLNAALAIPRIAAVFLAFLIALRLLGRPSLGATVLAVIAAAIGATGAAGFPLLATTMDESIPAALVLGAVLLAMRPGGAARAFLAGLLCGAAAGLKLTMAAPGAGLGIAILAGAAPPRLRVTRAAAFAAGCVVGAAALAGWWWWRVHALTGNPVFPYFNGIFHSPLLPPGNVVDTRFYPQTPWQWAFYPAFWAVRPFIGPAELPIRDPRIALALVAAAILGVRGWRQRDHAATTVAVFMWAGYAIWLWQFSILRYLSCMELLSGAVIVGALRPWLRRLLPAIGLGAVALAALIAVTRYPAWDRAPLCKRRVVCPAPIDVQLPPIAPGAVVLLLDPGPESYLRLFMPASARMLGAHNNIIGLDRGQPLQGRVQAALDARTGELWGVDERDAPVIFADATLAFYGLRRTTCQRIASNLDWGRLRICRLEPD